MREEVPVKVSFCRPIGMRIPFFGIHIVPGTDLGGLKSDATDPEMFSWRGGEPPGRRDVGVPLEFFPEISLTFETVVPPVREDIKDPLGGGLESKHGVRHMSDSLPEESIGWDDITRIRHFISHIAKVEYEPSDLNSEYYFLTASFYKYHLENS